MAAGTLVSISSFLSLSFLAAQAVTSCRLAQVLTQYCVCGNYYWLLVEGIYLHNLLGPMTFSEESYFPGYLLIGWGESAEASAMSGQENILPPLSDAFL